MTRFIPARFCAGLCLLSLSGFSQAGFLEMPDTSEVPEYEEGSMVLDLDIPGVRERNPNPEAGPRLNVKEFRLQGVVEFPELGITREALVERVEQLRFEIMQEDRQGDTGYTEEELAELADLIGDIEERTQGDHVESVDVQQLVFLIREQRRRRGVTLGMIETVADTITRYYRERGFMLAKAYIPKQHVRDGVVTLTLLLGELGKVSVENNKLYNTKNIQKIFDDTMGEPVTAERMEERLYLVNDMPGLAVRGYFQPGDQVGDTELVVNVLEEKRFASNLRVDNEGSESTGEYRAYLDLTTNKLPFVGGRLYLSGLSTFEPDNSNYGAFRYDRNIYGSRWRGSMGYSTNAFAGGLDEIDPELDDQSFSGKSSVADIGLSYVLKRSRASNYTVGLSIVGVDTEYDVLNTSGTAEKDESLNTSADFTFDLVDDKRRLLHIGNLALVHSSAEQTTSIGGGSGGSQTKPLEQVPEDDPSNDDVLQGDAVYFTYEYSMLGFIKLPLAKNESRLVVKSAGQYTGQLMSSVNRFALAGTSRARGFDVNRIYSDDGIYLGADLYFNGPGFSAIKVGERTLAKILQPYWFLDYSYGIVYPNSDNASGEFEERKVTLANLGLGLKLNLLDNLQGNLSVGFPLEENDDQDEGSADIEDSGTKFYASLQFSL